MAAVSSTMAVPGNKLEEHGRWLQWPHNCRGVAVAPVQEEHDAVLLLPLAAKLLICSPWIGAFQHRLGHRPQRWSGLQQAASTSTGTTIAVSHFIAALLGGLKLLQLHMLPENFSKECHILLMDPMLATGGTVAAAVDLLMERGAEISQIRIISAVAAPPALNKLNQRFPGICVYTGAMDQIVNEKGFIVPGLGDAGDRSYGT